MKYEKRNELEHRGYGLEGKGDRFTDITNKLGFSRPQEKMTPDEIRTRDIKGILQRAVNEGVAVDQLAMRETGDKRTKLLDEIHALLDETRALTALATKAVEGPAENKPKRFIECTGRRRSTRRRITDDTKYFHSEKYRAVQVVVDGKWKTIAYQLIAVRNCIEHNFTPVQGEQPWQDSIPE